MKVAEKTPKDGLGKKLKRQFLAGILIVVPIGASVLILFWMFNSIDNILQPVINAVLGQNIPGVGFAVTVLLIYLIGLMASNIVGKKLIHWGESLLARLPVFRHLYTGSKQILESFSAPRQTGFMQVVLVEYPRKGLRTLGFITNELPVPSGEKLFNVFIPTAPNPTSGFLEIVREEDMVRTRIPVDEALKMIVSAGRVSIKEVGEHLS